MDACENKTATADSPPAMCSRVAGTAVWLNCQMESVCDSINSHFLQFDYILNWSEVNIDYAEMQPMQFHDRAEK